ncbi:minor capsid protein [Corallococcus sp. AS-1-12]|uniref:minor capsid protein n=1 Tax=Corallococcus sp. AS-1-12 TaxID=2874598 RepID=UPI001CC012F8|nr:minor capsid protein [Corallococcus sp. AS-1-12]
MRDIALELAVLLEGAGLGLVRPPAPGANLFTAPMPEADGDMPDRAVALMVTGGAGPQAYVGLRRAAYLTLAFQVRVRSAREDFEGGQQCALGVYSVLHCLSLVPYAIVRAEESAPIYLGIDGSDRPRWSLNFSIGCVLPVRSLV